MYRNYGLLIGNEWRPAADGGVIEVFSPATEERLGTIPASTEADEALALDAALQAFAFWKAVPAWDRAATLRGAADIMRERIAEIAHLMSAETGKPIAEAEAEVRASADQFEWYGEEAKRIYGQTIPGRNGDERLSVVYQPVGPSLALTAWNFPMLLPARKIAAALAAGCTVVLRPASETPGSAMEIGRALIDAGLPAGCLSILTGNAVPMVSRLIASPVIRKVSLTGSVPVGREILRNAAEGIKKVTMELGGHAPVIVHSDFNPVAAAQKLAATKFRNCGQVCISPSRFYVHRSIAAAFAETFAAYAKKLVVGNGANAGVTMGPMIRARSLRSAEALVADALQNGARLLAGGKRPSHLPKGHFFEPTVLADVSDAARIMSEEPFAPIAPITVFDSFDEVIQRANATEFGLAAYVFTRDSALAAKTSEALEAGMVGINETLLATAEAPFGGVRQSGFGREGGSLGILDYLTPKYIRHKLVTGH